MRNQQPGSLVDFPTVDVPNFELQQSTVPTDKCEVLPVKLLGNLFEVPLAEPDRRELIRQQTSDSDRAEQRDSVRRWATGASVSRSND